MRRSFDIRGLDCANCAAKIEKAAKNIPGADHVSLDFVRRRLTLEADEAVFDRVLSDIMEKAADIEPTMRINRGGPDKDQIFSVIKITASAFLFLTALLVPFSDKIKLILFIGAYAVSAYDILYKALRNIFKGHVFDENFLMSIATIGAIAISEYAEAVAVMLFYQTGELFQSIAVGKSRRSVSDLMDIRPDKAVVLRNGEEISVSPEKVEKGEILVVRPGEKIALDGIIVEGATSINSSAITGESIPQEKYEGDRVLSGTLNISGLIKIRTESVYSESTAAKIHKLMENAYGKKAKTERFISRFAGYYTPAVVISAAILALLPPAILGGGFREWLGRALVFLVVSCPCALVVSIPLSFCGGIGATAKKGILVKGANFIEALASADTVAFDKTGTVTKGSFKTENIYSLGISEEELVELAAHIEAFSKHPVAKALTDAYGRETDREKISSVKEIPGKGIETCIDGKRYFAGNEKLMKQASLKYEPYLGNGTAVHIGSEERYLGYIALNDEIKEDAEQAVRRLRRCGIKKTVMLSGDGEQRVRDVKEKLGIDECFFGLLPNGKTDNFSKIKESGAKVIFVGDGINDAPVLAMADVGIAMGALGSDAAIEAADVVLTDDRISALPEAVEISKRTMGIVWQNLIFSLSVKMLILILSAFGIANMWMAVFGDVGVSIIAVLNSLRAMRYKSRMEKTEK